MSHCPHCGKPLDIVKMEDVTAAKPVGRPAEDLSAGVMKAVSESIDEKIAKKVEETTDVVVSSLAKLNRLANGVANTEVDKGLGAGWGGMMLHSMKKREEMVAKGYDPKEFVKKDAESVDRNKAASMLQNMIHGFLSKGDKK